MRHQPQLQSVLPLVPQRRHRLLATSPPSRGSLLPAAHLHLQRLALELPVALLRLPAVPQHHLRLSPPAALLLRPLPLPRRLALVGGVERPALRQVLPHQVGLRSEPAGSVQAALQTTATQGP